MKKIPLFESSKTKSTLTNKSKKLLEADLPKEDKDFLKSLFGGEHGNEMKELSDEERSKLGDIFTKVRKLTESENGDASLVDIAKGQIEAGLDDESVKSKLIDSSDETDIEEIEQAIEIAHNITLNESSEPNQKIINEALKYMEKGLHDELVKSRLNNEHVWSMEDIELAIPIARRVFLNTEN